MANVEQKRYAHMRTSQFDGVKHHIPKKPMMPTAALCNVRMGDCGLLLDSSSNAC